MAVVSTTAVPRAVLSLGMESVLLLLVESLFSIGCFESVPFFLLLKKGTLVPAIT